MTYIVAEIGVNWDGDFDLAKEMMLKSKLAGCDAVKFQAFTEEMVKEHPEKSRLIKSSISNVNIEAINDLSKNVGIEWFCTPMYPEAVNLLDPYLKKFKIRVADGKPLLENKSTELFERILKTDKDIMVSCQTSPRGTKYFDHSKIDWLYCVPKYPCNLNELDFSNMDDFDGFSNHCPHFLAALTAKILGAKILEIHITSDKSKNFFDNNVSFDYTELTDLVKLVRLVEQIKA
jgi:sialic acid synthase SpsE